MSNPSMTTKLDLVNSALSKIAISGITAPATPDDYQTLLFRLEGLMYEMERTRNICCDYNYTKNPDTGDPHGMDFALFEPISNILAIRVLQDYEIPPGPALSAAATAAISSLSAQTFRLQETQYPRRQARGSGNTLRYNRWQRFYRQPARVPVTCDTIRMTTREINDYEERFSDYLNPGETITAFSITPSPGLSVLNTRNDGFTIFYRLEALTPSQDSGVEQLSASEHQQTELKTELLLSKTSTLTWIPVYLTCSHRGRVLVLVPSA